MHPHPHCPETYAIPDLLKNWPYERILSTHYAQVREESDQWANSIRLFDEEKRKAYLACDISMLGALTYSSRDEKEFIRLGCDLMNVFFLVDEYTDTADGNTVRTVMNSVCKFLESRDPISIQPNSAIEVMSQQFWIHALKMASPGDNCLENFAKGMKEYLCGVIEEAEERTTVGRIQSISDYLDVRRRTSGGEPTLSLFEFGLELPKDVLQHPVILQLTSDAAEMILLVNDMHSFPREYSRDGSNCHNILTYVMKEKMLDLPAALDWLEMYANGVTQRFLANLKQVPSWDKITDDKVNSYIDGLGQWVRGNNDWSFEGRRYYRGNGLKVKATMQVVSKNSEQGFFIDDVQLKKTLGVVAVS